LLSTNFYVNICVWVNDAFSGYDVNLEDRIS